MPTRNKPSTLLTNFNGICAGLTFNPNNNVPMGTIQNDEDNTYVTYITSYFSRVTPTTSIYQFNPYSAYDVSSSQISDLEFLKLFGTVLTTVTAQVVLNAFNTGSVLTLAVQCCGNSLTPNLDASNLYSFEFVFTDDFTISNEVLIKVPLIDCFGATELVSFKITANLMLGVTPNKLSRLLLRRPSVCNAQSISETIIIFFSVLEASVHNYIPLISPVNVTNVNQLNVFTNNKAVYVLNQCGGASFRLACTTLGSLRSPVVQLYYGGTYSTLSIPPLS